MAKKIMLIRHAEKPDKLSGIFGVSPLGMKDKEALSVRGWQRAGALVRFFAPFREDCSHPSLATPQFLFACKILPDNKSRRALQTIEPLAEHLSLKVNLDHAEGEEPALIEAVLAAPGNVLISWKHNTLPHIGKAFSERAPDTWPITCFDKIWVFEARGTGFDFVELPQLLLPGDEP
jgi:hypothetical protein